MVHDRPSVSLGCDKCRADKSRKVVTRHGKRPYGYSLCSGCLTVLSALVGNSEECYQYYHKSRFLRPRLARPDLCLAPLVQLSLVLATKKCDFARVLKSLL